MYKMVMTINRKTLVNIVLNSYFWQFDAIFDHFEVIFGQTEVKLDKKKVIYLLVVNHGLNLLGVSERLTTSFVVYSKLLNKRQINIINYFNNCNIF